MVRLIKKIINSFFFNYNKPIYSKNLYNFCLGYTYLYNNYCNPNIITNGEYDYLKKFLLKKNRPIVIDVGANIGDYTNIIRQCNNSAIVHCFEPSEESYKLLETRFKNSNKITMNRAACGDRNTGRFLYMNIDHGSFSSFNPSYVTRAHKHKKEYVNVVSLDFYCKKNRIKRINLLKIDTEGHEIFVLNGAKNLMKNSCIDIIQFEYGYASIYNHILFLEFVELFNKFKYELYLIKPKRLEKIDYQPEMEGTPLANYLGIKKGLSITKLLI